MNMFNYISGAREGREANRLERRLIYHEMTREALKGYQDNESGAESVAAMDTIANDIKHKVSVPKRWLGEWWGSFATLSLCALLVWGFVLPEPQQVEPLIGRNSSQSGDLHFAANTQSEIISGDEGSRFNIVDNAEKNNARPGVGIQEYESYLRRSLVNSDDAGNVTLSFRVNQSGRPSDIRVENGGGGVAGRKAIELIANGPAWLPSEGRVTVMLRI